MKEINFSSFNNLTKEEKYKEVIPAICSLVEGEKNKIANLANLLSVLKYTFDYYLWVGFYFVDPENKTELVLGPFQGKVSCTRLKIDKGVCATAVQKRETIIVDNVYDFPGHIFCDSNSRSEIVLPIFKNNEVIAVLDIDSGGFSAFDGTDKKYLEELISRISYLF